MIGLYFSLWCSTVLECYNEKWREIRILTRISCQEITFFLKENSIKLMFFSIFSDRNYISNINLYGGIYIMISRLRLQGWKRFPTMDRHGLWLENSQYPGVLLRLDTEFEIIERFSGLHIQKIVNEVKLMTKKFRR